MTKKLISEGKEKKSTQLSQNYSWLNSQNEIPNLSDITNENI